jgi:Na+/H+-translocating membrane pyrophosphatase
MVVVFVNSANFTGSTSLRSPSVFLGLLVGAMSPYFFNACLIRSVYKSAPALPFDIKMQI